MKKITIKKKQHISIHSYHTRKGRNFIMKNLWLGWVCILTFLGNACKQEYLSSYGDESPSIIDFAFIDSFSGKDLFFGDYGIFNKSIDKNFVGMDSWEIIDTLEKVGFPNATLFVDSLTFNGKKSTDYNDIIEELFKEYGHQLNNTMNVVLHISSIFIDSSNCYADRISFRVTGYPSTWDNEEYVLRVEYNNNLLGTLKARFRILSTRERKKYPSYSRCIERNFYSHPSNCYLMMKSFVRM